MPFYIQFDYPDGRVDELQSRDYQNVLDALITKFSYSAKKNRNYVTLQIRMSHDLL